MTEQLYSLHVDQWPAAVDVTVKIVSPDDGRERVTVEAIDGFPFAHGYSLPVYSQDMWWYRETIVNRSRLTALPAAPDNTDRIAALQAELNECNMFVRALEIIEQLETYGVHVVAASRADELMDAYASGRETMRSGNLSDRQD